MESVRKSMEGQFEGEVSLDELSVLAGVSRYHFAYVATIKASWERIFALIREMLAVERRRQLDDGEQRANTGVPGAAHCVVPGSPKCGIQA